MFDSNETRVWFDIFMKQDIAFSNQLTHPHQTYSNVVQWQDKIKLEEIKTDRHEDTQTVKTDKQITQMSSIQFNNQITFNTTVINWQMLEWKYQRLNQAIYHCHQESSAKREQQKIHRQKLNGQSNPLKVNELWNYSSQSTYWIKSWSIKMNSKTTWCVELQ